MGDIDIEVRGLRETQARYERLVEQLAATGGLEAIIAEATLMAHRYATMITHVDTGRLKNSHFPRVTAQGNQVYGEVGTNVAYAVYEHARGGSHAFYQRTVDEEGPRIVSLVERRIQQAVEGSGG